VLTGASGKKSLTEDRFSQTTGKVCLENEKSGPEEPLGRFHSSPKTSAKPQNLVITSILLTQNRSNHLPTMVSLPMVRNAG
jgi:hypothetical protein